MNKHDRTIALARIDEAIGTLQEVRAMFADEGEVTAQDGNNPDDPGGNPPPPPPGG